MSTIIGTGQLASRQLAAGSGQQEERGQRAEDGIQKQLIDLLAAYYSASRGWKAAPTVSKTRYHGTRRAGKAVPTVTPKTVAYSNILIYDLLSGKGIGIIQPIGCALEGLESI